MPTHVNDDKYGTFGVDCPTTPGGSAAVWRSESYDADQAAEDALKMMDQTGLSRALARAPGLCITMAIQMIVAFTLAESSDVLARYCPNHPAQTSPNGSWQVSTRSVLLASCQCCCWERGTPELQHQYARPRCRPLVREARYLQSCDARGDSTLPSCASLQQVTGNLANKHCLSIVMIH